MGDTKSLATQLPKVLGKPGRRRGFTEAHLLMAWQSLCPEYAQFCRPEKLWAQAGKGTLTVAVNSDSARMNIQMWLPTLMQRINTFYGYEAVTDIRLVTKDFKVEPKPQPAPTKPLDKKALAKAEELCKHVGNEGLREELTKLGARIITTKKDDSAC